MSNVVIQEMLKKKNPLKSEEREIRTGKSNAGEKKKRSRIKRA